MTTSTRVLIAIPLGAAGALLLCLGIVDLWIAAFGDTGETSLQVPLVFGLLFLAGATVFSLGAVTLWRRASR